MVIDFAPGEPFVVGCLKILPFALPHDAAETVGFRVSDGSARAGFATDLGSLTLEVLEGLSGCDAVVLESNHDEAMLLGGPYPPFLKRRVNGPDGHLSNSDAAELIRCVCHDGLRHLALAHLSRTNNTPELPLEAARRALGARASGVEISLGWQDRAGEVIRLG
jgi:phosphoribosyl 1,2-cyclic phosphodiesterase